MAIVARDTSAGLSNLNDLQVGKSLPQGSEPQSVISPEIASAVESWNEKYSSTPGYRSGSTYAPEQMRETIEVSSALQLPAILAKLHGPDAHNVRLQFPQPALGTDEERVAIRAEQTAIHKFLQTSHGKDLGELLQEVKGLIESSSSFRRDKESGQLPQEMTADLWIQAAVGEKLEQIAKLPQKLDVSDVVEIGSKKIESVKASLELALKDAVESSRGLIITIPNTQASAENREHLKDLLRRFVEEREKLPDFSEETLARIKVWVGASKKDITKGQGSAAPCAKVEEFSLPDFLRAQETEGPRRREERGQARQEVVPSGGISPDPSEEKKPEQAQGTQAQSENVVEATGTSSTSVDDLVSWEYLVMPSNEKVSQIDTYAIDTQSGA